MSDYDKLRELAVRAQETRKEEKRLLCLDNPENYDRDAAYNAYQYSVVAAREFADAANPQAILALLDELEAAQAKHDRLLAGLRDAKRHEVTLTEYHRNGWSTSEWPVKVIRAADVDALMEDA